MTNRSSAWPWVKPCLPRKVVFVQFPTTFMQILLWQPCTSVFVGMCHFEMTADPTGPLGSWRAWAEVAGPYSWQSCSNSSNTERGLWGAHWSCSRTSELEETSIEPPSPYIHSYVWIYVCIYKNILTHLCLNYCCQEGGYAEQCHFMSCVRVLRNAQAISTRFTVKSSCSQDYGCKRDLPFYPSHSYNPKGRKC